MIREPLHDIANKVDIAGLDLLELGVVLKQAVVRSELRVGCAARLMQQTFLGDVVADLDKDVLPLPVPTPSAEERRILQAMEASAQPTQVLRDFPRSVKNVAHSSWLFLVIVVLNLMFTGFAPLPAQLAEPMVVPIS